MLALFFNSHEVVATQEDASFGPLYESFSLTLTIGSRVEALGPFHYAEDRGGQDTWALPPLMSSVSNPEVDTDEFDLLFPAVTYDRFGPEYRFQLLQLFSLSGGGLQSGGTKDRFTLFPVYFQQRSADSNENYTALFPIYGTLRNRLFRDEIDFALWPLYVKTIRRPGSGSVGADEILPLSNRWASPRRGDITTFNFVAPIFHLRYGDGLRGWQFWPLAGHEQKSVTLRTNAWGDTESVPGHEKSFILWPLWLSETRAIGTTNISHFNALLPLYSSLRSPDRDSTSYLWPLGLTLIDDRARQYQQTELFWPVFARARGEGKTTTRLWPLFGVSHNQVAERNFYLWPLYQYSHVHSEPLDRSRTQILFFLYSDVREKNTATLKESRRVDCWPLFTKTCDPDGNRRLQVLAIVEPILSKSEGVERNYSPLWSLWRSEHNQDSGGSSQSLLWNLYRHQQSPDGSSRTSFLFGLFQHRSSQAGSALRLFFIPLKRPPPPAATAVDSTGVLAHPVPGINPATP